jgi:hypothetical protein
MTGILGGLIGSFKAAAAIVTDNFISIATEAYVGAVYAWTSSGFGTRVTTPNLNEVVSRTRFSPSGQQVAFTLRDASSSSLFVYPWSASGFGTRYIGGPTATGLDTRVMPIDFSPSGDVIAFGSRNSFPYIHAYVWNPGYGSKFANPATPPTRSQSVFFGDMRFSPSGDALIMVSSARDGSDVNAYAWNSGFGTRYSNPSLLDSAGHSGLSFHPTGNSVIFRTEAFEPYIHAYAWNPGFGTKFADPINNPGPSESEPTQGVAFSPSGNAVIAGGNSNTSFVTAWNWNSGFGTKFADPSVNRKGFGVAFSRTGNVVAVTSDNSPIIHAYAWNPGFGTKFADPTGTNLAKAWSVDWA